TRGYGGRRDRRCAPAGRTTAPPGTACRDGRSGPTGAARRRPCSPRATPPPRPGPPPPPRRGGPPGPAPPPTTAPRAPTAPGARAPGGQQRPVEPVPGGTGDFPGGQVRRGGLAQYRGRQWPTHAEPPAVDRRGDDRPGVRAGRLPLLDQADVAGQALAQPGVP